MKQQNMTGAARRPVRWDTVDVGRRKELVRGAPLLPDIQALRDNYVPRRTPREDWERVRQHVLAWFDLASPTDRQIGLRLFVNFTKFALWAEERHLPLDPNVLFTPAMVDRFVEYLSSNESERVAVEARVRLRRYGPVVGDNKQWSKKGPQYNTNSLLRPLDVATERFILKNTKALLTPHHHGFVVLGFGCGLDGRWLPHVRGVDVIELDGWPHVQTTDPDQRLVPVRDMYADDLVQLAQLAGDDYVIGGGGLVQNRCWTLGRRIMVDADRRIVIAEMRTTWFAAHLRNRTDPTYLRSITGSTEAFLRLMRLTEFLDMPVSRPVVEAARLA